MAAVMGLVVIAVLATCLTLARRLVQVRPAGEGYPLRVVALGGPSTTGGAASTVTVTRGADADEPGTFRLSWPGGSARAGPVVAESATTVTRSLSQVTGNLRVGQPVGIQADPLTGDPTSALQLPFHDVAVAGPTGNLPAWMLDGTRHTWVVLIHGLDGSRSDTLAAMGVLHTLGFPTLAITYRNDVGAAASGDGHSHLGDTEWRDVDAAVGYALGHGATGVVLYGWSLGGGMAVVTSEQSSQRSRVRALILDSPLLDWPATLARSSSLRNTPAPVRWTTEAMLRLGLGVDLSRYRRARLAAALGTPTLLVQGSADRVVPPDQAAAFARARPDLVAYLPVAGADHVSAIDVDPAGYTAAVVRLLSPLP